MELQGSRRAEGGRFAVVVSRFNEDITEGLLSGARNALSEAGVDTANLTIVRVPGAFELPLAARQLASTGRYNAIVCLGCVIKGETMHFEYIASAVSHGLMDVAVSTGVPVTFGVLTTLTEEQAIARAADDANNKGREAALAAVEMAAVLRQISTDVESDG